MRTLIFGFAIVAGALASSSAFAADNGKICSNQHRACMKNYAGPTCQTEYRMCTKSCRTKSRGSL